MLSKKGCCLETLFRMRDQVKIPKTDTDKDDLKTGLREKVIKFDDQAQGFP